MTEFSLIKEVAQNLDQDYETDFFFAAPIQVSKSFAVFQIRYLVTDVSHYKPSHCVLIAYIGTIQCPFPGPLQMIHRARKNQQVALRALLQAGGRSFINLHK